MREDRIPLAMLMAMAVSVAVSVAVTTARGAVVVHGSTAGYYPGNLRAATGCAAAAGVVDAASRLFETLHLAALLLVLGHVLVALAVGGVTRGDGALLLFAGLVEQGAE